jgi:hypothetical protein
MKSDVAMDMGWSSKLFIESAWPMVQSKFNSGPLLQMEGRPDVELATQLDMRSGIDGWELTSEGGMRGVSARVQTSPTPPNCWDSFTVRMSRNSGALTEFSKRRNAIHGGKGLIYPHITVQAYAESKVGPVHSVGICKTQDLIQFIDNGLHKKRLVSNAEFAACFWKDMKDNGFDVWIARSDEFTTL